MREDIARVDVTPDTLKAAPDAWEGGEEAKEAGVGGVAEWWVGPMVRIEAEEDFDVLKKVRERSGLWKPCYHTPIEYVSEQNMSPRKKSRNSTG